jgi:hypothetical protein
MLWEAPSAAIKQTKSVLTLKGTPVSRAFTVMGGADGEPMRHILAVIDSLHADGVIPFLIAKREIMEGRNGQFVAGRGILIHPQTPIGVFVTAHEMGHVLDFYGFTPGRYESLSGHEMARVFDAWIASISYRALQMLRARLSASSADPVNEATRQRDLGKVNYLLRLDEVWSRAYSQWLATSSQDPILLQQLETLRQDPNYSDLFVQWSDADFVRIGQEIDLLFKRRGWLQ